MPQPNQIYSGGTAPIEPRTEALISTPEPVLPDEPCPKPGELSKRSHSPARGHPALQSIPPAPAALLHKHHYSTSDFCKETTKSATRGLCSVMLGCPREACLHGTSTSRHLPRAGADCCPAIHLSVVPPTTFSWSLDRNSLGQVTCHLWNASVSQSRRITKLLDRASQCHWCSGLARAGFACVGLKGTGHTAGQGFLTTC